MPSFLISRNGTWERHSNSHIASFMLPSHSNHKALIIHNMTQKQPSSNPSMLCGQLTFMSHPSLWFCPKCNGLQETHVLLSRRRLLKNVASFSFILWIVWANIEKKRSHHSSHIQYEHVHDGLSQCYKYCQMVANVWEGSSTNINLDVIACMK